MPLAFDRRRLYSQLTGNVSPKNIRKPSMFRIIHSQFDCASLDLLTLLPSRFAFQKECMIPVTLLHFRTWCLWNPIVSNMKWQTRLYSRKRVPTLTNRTRNGSPRPKWCGVIRSPSAKAIITYWHVKPRLLQKLVRLVYMKIAECLGVCHFSWKLHV